MKRQAAAAAMTAAMIAGAASGEPAPCEDPLVSVTAPEPEEVARVCAAAAAAKGHLASCDLAQSRPLTIEVVEEIDGPADHCAGLYLCDRDLIRIIPPGDVEAQMPPGSAFAALTPRVYFDSLVVHEMAHALMDQAACAEPRCAADLEYVAYAMQIESLPEAERERLLAFREVERPVPDERLNDLVLWMKPDIFALHAWAHFDEPGNGCAFVQDLVQGEATLALPRP